MAENEVESMELDDSAMDQISGGRKKKTHWGTWYVAHRNDGVRRKFYNYDEAVDYVNANGGGTIETCNGVVSNNKG